MSIYNPGNERNVVIEEKKRTFRRKNVHLGEKTYIQEKNTREKRVERNTATNSVIRYPSSLNSGSVTSYRVKSGICQWVKSKLLIRFSYFFNKEI